jgi:hypothetical protein
VRETIDPHVWAYLTDAERPGDCSPMRWFVIGHRSAMHWETHRAEVLRWWIERFPGTRPDAWWRFDAPRSTEGAGTWMAGTLPLQRRRLGGTGEHGGGLYPILRYGIPISWRWRPAGVLYLVTSTVGRGMADPRDPPRFEAQATYLRRHGLLGSAEASRLTEQDFADGVICGPA